MTTLYERVGGDGFFESLTRRFYEGVSTDPVLAPLYPTDIEPGRIHLRDFLIQYFGGPATYSEERGHPRLRMRHADFAISTAQRSAWLSQMVAALRADGIERLDPGDAEQIIGYFEAAATHMVNRND